MASDLPFMKFYVDDWLADEKARLCTSGARGLWMDMLCLMWKSDERGVLVQPNGFPVDARLLARVTGNGNKSTVKWLTELETFGVCSIDENGSYFCRRMLKDERIRRVRAEAGKKGGAARVENTNHDLLGDLLNQNGKQNSSKSVASGMCINKQSSLTQEGGCKGDDGFEKFWKLYPHKLAKKKALRAWLDLDPDSELVEKIVLAIQNQIQAGTLKPKKDQIPLHAATWINDGNWENEVPMPRNGSAGFAVRAAEIEANKKRRQEENAKLLEDRKKNPLPRLSELAKQKPQ